MLDLQADTGLSLWVLACFLSIWSPLDSDQRGNADSTAPLAASIDNMAPIYTSMRLVGSHTSGLPPAQASLHILSLAELLNSAMLSTDRWPQTALLIPLTWLHATLTRADLSRWQEVLMGNLLGVRECQSGSVLAAGGLLEGCSRASPPFAAHDPGLVLLEHLVSTSCRHASARLITA